MTALKSLRTFVESLDQGYHLECAGVGLIFDLGFRGVETHEEHSGLVYHRVGRDYVERLLNNGLRRRALLQEQAQVKPAAIEEAQRQAEERQQIVRDTTLHGDVSYQRVRTHFDLTLKGKRGFRASTDRGQRPSDLTGTCADPRQAG